MLLYDPNSRIAKNNKIRSSHASTMDHLRRRRRRQAHGFFLFEYIPAGALSTFLFRLRRQKLDI
jgi:hypothetical protein